MLGRGHPATISLRHWHRQRVLNQWLSIALQLLVLVACGLPLALVFGVYTHFSDRRAIVLGEIAGMMVIGWTVFAFVADESYSQAVTDFLDEIRLPGHWREQLRRVRASGADLEAPLERLFSPGRIFVNQNGFFYYRIRAFDGRAIEMDEIAYWSNGRVSIWDREERFVNSFLHDFGGWYEERWPPHPLAGKGVRRRIPTPERWPGTHLDLELNAAQIAELDLGY